MAITKPEKTILEKNKGKSGAVGIKLEHYLIIKDNADSDRVKSILSQNAIKYKDVAVFSMDDS